MELFQSFRKILSAMTYGKIVMTLLSSKSWSGSLKAKFKVWNMLKADTYNKKGDALCILPARRCNPQFPIFARNYGLETTYSRDLQLYRYEFFRQPTALPWQPGSSPQFLYYQIGVI